MNNLKKIILSKRKECYIIKIYENSDKILDFVASLLNNGAKFIQLKQFVSSSDFLDISLKIKQLCAIFDAILIIEDRIDIAKLISADGVFLDKHSIDIPSAVKIIDKEMIIGSDYDSSNADYIISNKEYDNIITYLLDSNDAEYKAIYEEMK